MVKGHTLPDLFAMAGWSFFDLMLDARKIAYNQERSVKVTAPDREALLVAWLGELLFLFESRHLVFGAFEIQTFNDRELLAKVRGELFDPRRHRVKQVFKAVTYHQLRIWEEKGVWRARVIFDL